MCKLDKRRYPTGRSISKEQMKELKLNRATFHGEWNYSLVSADGSAAYRWK